MNNNTYVLDSKKKVVVIHQPDFLPYIGFFHKLLCSDQWIIYDTAQFISKGKGWHNRDKIKTDRGAQWVTVSVEKAPLKTPINQIKLSKSVDWRNKNLNLIKQNYRKALYYKTIYAYLEELYSVDVDDLLGFNMFAIEMFLKLLDMDIKIEYVSNLKPVGDKNTLLIDVLDKVNATHYLTGDGSIDYLKPNLFEDNNIIIIWQKFTHPLYNQLYGNFIPNLSIIDMLFNCGIDQSQEIIRKL